MGLQSVRETLSGGIMLVVSTGWIRASWQGEK
jgi:hypothetical protein